MDTIIKPKDYILYERRTTISQLARDIGYSRVHLSNVLNGITRCGKGLARTIAKWSNNDITPENMESLYDAVHNKID